MGTSLGAERANTKGRISALLVFLNIVLLAGLLYTTFGRSLTPGGGTSLVIINDTASPMIDLSLSYPGGNFSVPRLDPQGQVGNPARHPGRFEAILTFKDEAGHAYKETVRVRPVGEFHINIHVLPVLEESVVKKADGVEEKVYKPSPSRVRILTSYEGENLV